jgi:hypothetical protein
MTVQSFDQSDYVEIGLGHASDDMVLAADAQYQINTFIKRSCLTLIKRVFMGCPNQGVSLRQPRKAAGSSASCDMTTAVPFGACGGEFFR